MVVLLAAAGLVLAWLMCAYVIAWLVCAAIERGDRHHAATLDTLAPPGDAAWEKLTTR